MTILWGSSPAQLNYKFAVFAMQAPKKRTMSAMVSFVGKYLSHSAMHDATAGILRGNSALFDRERCRSLDADVGCCRRAVPNHTPLSVLRSDTGSR